MLLHRHALVLAVLLLPGIIVPSRPVHPAGETATWWTSLAGAAVYMAPSYDAGVLARLPDNQPVRIAVVSPRWARTLLWNALPGWVPLASLSPRPFVRPPFVGQPIVLHPAGGHAPLPLQAHLRLREPASLRAAPGFAAARLAVLHTGTVLAVDAWATDTGGAAWYHVRGAIGTGWIYGDAATFGAARPASAPGLLAPLRGKGMWFTYPLVRTSPASAIVSAARANGLTHLYVEVGRSREGFYGASGLAALLPAAHRAGIRVIAWVYPYLEDIPADVAMTVAAARYVAPSGDRPDGLLADVEENMAEPAVRAYGQIVRALLGPGQLMAVATYPPQVGVLGQNYPFATVALSWNVIVPMDYWHLRRRTYTAADAYRYVTDSVRIIRARTRPDEPVEVLGQMFDRDQSGVNSPSAAEIAACGRAARDVKAIGVSFFEWNHATPEEWGALAALPEVGE